jgi:hypothetical protein
MGIFQNVDEFRDMASAAVIVTGVDGCCSGCTDPLGLYISYTMHTFALAARMAEGRRSRIASPLCVGFEPCTDAAGEPGERLGSPLLLDLARRCESR